MNRSDETINHLLYADMRRGILRDISQEALEACGDEHPGTPGPLPCLHCWDGESGPPTYILDEGKYWLEHAAHDTEARFCKECDKRLDENNQAWISKYPGYNVHIGCIKQ